MHPKYALYLNVFCTIDLLIQCNAPLPQPDSHSNFMHYIFFLVNHVCRIKAMGKQKQIPNSLCLKNQTELKSAQETIAWVLLVLALSPLTPPLARSEHLEIKEVFR